MWALCTIWIADYIGVGDILYICVINVWRSSTCTWMIDLWRESSLRWNWRTRLLLLLRYWWLLKELWRLWMNRSSSRSSLNQRILSLIVIDMVRSTWWRVWILMCPIIWMKILSVVVKTIIIVRNWLKVKFFIYIVNFVQIKFTKRSSLS